MKNWNTRLRILEALHFLTQGEAEEILTLIIAAVRHHTTQEQQDLLVNAYAKIFMETFQRRAWLSQPHMELWIDRLIALTKIHVNPNQARDIAHALMKHSQPTGGS